jgi:cytoskeleton protein RodZ
MKSLEVVVAQDAWVEITTMSGTKIVSRLMKTGSKELFEVNEPVVLIVGNVSGVQAKLRGQVLNLKAVAHDNVSKLNLK